MMTPDAMQHAVTFAAVAVMLFFGHMTGDYLVQTNKQAKAKRLPGWTGRFADARHVATLTLTLVAALVALALVTGLPLSPAKVAVSLAVNAASHWWADRVTTLDSLARRLLRKGDWLDRDPGALALIDQAWHMFWLAVTALIIAS